MANKKKIPWKQIVLLESKIEPITASDVQFPPGDRENGAIW